jgi:hypothetical protein
MDGAKIKKIPLTKIAVHQDARFAFRFTQTLTPQCNISLVRACHTGTWSSMFPIVVKIENVFHVIGGWQGLLFSGEVEDQVFVVVLKNSTNADVRTISMRFAVSMLLSQTQKNKHNGAISELAEHRPELLSGLVFNKSFDTPRSFSYSLAPIDPKSVDTQRARINEERLDCLRSAK